MPHQQAIEEWTKEQVCRDVRRHVGPYGSLFPGTTNDSSGRRASRMEQAFEQFGSHLGIVLRLTEQRGEELAGQPIHGVRGITELSDNGARGICARGERDGGRVDFREHLHQERRSVGPPPVDRRLGDAGARRDRFDSGRRVSGFLKQFTRGVEDGPLRLGAAGAACRWTGRVRRAT